MTGLSNTAPETRGCSPRQTATSPPDPRPDHACSRVLTTAQHSRRTTPTRSPTPVSPYSDLPLFGNVTRARSAEMDRVRVHRQQGEPGLQYRPPEAASIDRADFLVIHGTHAGDHRRHATACPGSAAAARPTRALARRRRCVGAD